MNDGNSVEHLSIHQFEMYRKLKLILIAINSFNITCDLRCHKYVMMKGKILGQWQLPQKMHPMDLILIL